MAVHGKATAVVVGAFDPSRYFNEISLGWTLDTHDASGFQMEAKEYVAGQNDSTVSASGFWQGSLDSVQADFEDGLGDGDEGERLYLVLFGGWSVGARCATGYALRTAFDVTSPVSDLVSTSFSLQGQPGRRSMAVALSPTTPLTDVAPNGATHDNAAGTVSGALVQVHVLANTMDAATDLVVQHSVNGSVWADLLTLPLAAGDTTATRVTVAGTVNRYTRVIADPAGTGTIVAAVALARN